MTVEAVFRFAFYEEKKSKISFIGVSKPQLLPILQKNHGKTFSLPSFFPLTFHISLAIYSRIYVVLRDRSANYYAITQSRRPSFHALNILVRDPAILKAEVDSSLSPQSHPLTVVSGCRLRTEFIFSFFHLKDVGRTATKSTVIHDVLSSLVLGKKNGQPKRCTECS